MLKRIIYTLSIVCLILLTIITKDMLPYIFKSKICGILYLSFTILLLVCELYALIKYKNVLKKSISYNSFLVVTTMYILIIYYRIYSINSSLDYTMNLKYLKINYLLLSFALLIIIGDLYLGIKEYSRKAN